MNKLSNKSLHWISRKMRLPGELSVSIDVGTDWLLQSKEGYMFSNLKLKSQWYAEAGDDFINEPAEICALYRVVGINKENDLVEIESEFYIDERCLSSDLYKEISNYKNKLKKIEVSVSFYIIAVSFMKSHINEGMQLVESTYSEAMKNYVSPLQSIRSIEISEYLFDSEKTIYNAIHQLPDYIDEPTAFDLLLNETSSD